jgi:hypothetical protein
MGEENNLDESGGGLDLMDMDREMFMVDLELLSL